MPWNVLVQKADTEQSCLPCLRQSPQYAPLLFLFEINGYVLQIANTFLSEIYTHDCYMCNLFCSSSKPANVFTEATNDLAQNLETLPDVLCCLESHPIKSNSSYSSSKWIEVALSLNALVCKINRNVYSQKTLQMLCLLRRDSWVIYIQNISGSCSCLLVCMPVCKPILDISVLNTASTTVTTYMAQNIEGFDMCARLRLLGFVTRCLQPLEILSIFCSFWPPIILILCPKSLCELQLVAIKEAGGMYLQALGRDLIIPASSWVAWCIMSRIAAAWSYLSVPSIPARDLSTMSFERHVGLLFCSVQMSVLYVCKLQCFLSCRLQCRQV